MEKMKVISIKQPFATLLCMGIKTAEIRSWKPKELGRYLIHATNENQYDLGYIPNLEDYTDWYFIKEVNKINKDRTMEHEYLYYEDGELKIRDSATDVQKCDFDKFIAMIEACTQKAGGLFGHSAIIGFTDFEEVKEVDGKYHWIVNDYRIFYKPIREIAGKLGVWYHDIDLTLQEGFRWLH